MKYHVSYECRTGKEIFSGAILIELPAPPSATEPLLIELILKDSIKFHQTGSGGVSIIAITPVVEQS